MLQRVPSNMNTGTQRNIDFPTKKREFGKSRSSTKADFSFLSLVLVVSVNAVMAQTFLPGVTNQNTGVRSKFLIRRGDNHILGVTLGRYTML